MGAGGKRDGDTLSPTQLESLEKEQVTRKTHVEER